MPTLALFLILAIPAEIVGTFVGFGATTLLVPAASLFLPIKDAIVLAALFHMFGTLWRALYFRGGIDWKIVTFFGIPSLILAGIGSYLLSISPAQWIARILGIFLILWAGAALSGRQFTLPTNRLFTAIEGALVGFLAGLIGTAGALRGAFLSSWNMHKDFYLGTGAAIGLGADVIKVVVYNQTGLLNFNLTIVFVFAVVALVGTTVGKVLVGKTGQETFRKIVLVALILAGLRFLVQ
ncbi:sulfite exporter TauE/SafE family protein [Candidatus Microgenomates bacterium]|nr:sulfite exporter TauE/SafE family protein [Candidatus Microgenomates bacterium]